MVKNSATLLEIKNNPHDYPVFATSEQRERERLRQLEAIGCRPATIPQACRDELERYFKGKKKGL